MTEIVERLRAKRELSSKRPTIAELEAILAEPSQSPVQILPNGEVTADAYINPDGPEAATLIETLREEANAANAHADELEARAERAESIIETQQAMVGAAEGLLDPAVVSAANFLVERFRSARCDSEAVSDCVRCTAFFLANKVLAETQAIRSLLERTPL